MKIKKTRIATIMLLFLIATSAYASAISSVKAERSLTAWGVECMMTEDEQDASSDVCDNIASYFSSASGYSTNSVESFYGEDTSTSNVFDHTSYCDCNYDFATVFYKGHSVWGIVSPPPNQILSYWLLDNDQERISDFAIGYNTQNGVHDFVFLWTCGMANEQGVVNTGVWTIGMSASWLYRDDLVEDTHDYPDSSGHCFISFHLASPDFVEYTGFSSHTIGEFVDVFYQYASDGYSIDAALDAAAQSCFNCNFENTWLQGYWRYFDAPQMGSDWYYCYIREFGDGSMTLTT